MRGLRVTRNAPPRFSRLALEVLGRDAPGDPGNPRLYLTVSRIIIVQRSIDRNENLLRYVVNVRIAHTTGGDDSLDEPEILAADDFAR